MPNAMRETTIAVELQRLDVESQARLDWLLDHNNEGRLTPAEREELQGLVAQYENLLLRNTESLLRATRPDLVDALWDDRGQMPRAFSVKKTFRAC